ncbi:MAG TPA: DUF6691 family protein, partial [Polyangia bacterium]
MKAAVGVVCGLLFAIGLAVSGMTLPSKVLGFLDLFGGAWDPSLAFVMVGAIGVFALARRLAPRRPLFEQRYPLLRSRGIDRRLVVGSLLFGVGWGLIGFCPGPAVVAFGAGVPGSLVFGASLLIGMAAFQV